MESLDFEKHLHEYLSPQRPIKSLEHLKGRETQLKEIDRALVAGTTVFIYGDRGVGKTSLAQTSAFKHHPSDSYPIFLSCDKISNALYLVREIAAELTNYNPVAHPGGAETKVGVNVGVFSAERTLAGKTAHDIAEPKSVNEAVNLIAAAVQQWRSKDGSKTPVVVIDEFDRMADQSQREFLGDLLKQVGDREVPIRLIFCGVARSLDELLKSHPSVYRYIQSVRLDRLSLEARTQILEHAAKALPIPFRNDQIMRIAIISDGYPYYVHLLGAKVAWEYRDDSYQPSTVTTEHFNRGIDAAVVSCEEHIRKMYENATQKYKLKYEHALWAAAAHANLQRASSQVFDDYSWIIGNIRVKSGQPLVADRKQFNTMMNNLKKDSHGAVLVGTRSGWYEFREPLLRGYCRLIAKQNGIDIGPDR